MEDEKSDENNFNLESSVLKWQIETAALIDGKRELNLIQLGSSEEYIEVRLANSKDEIFERQCFHQALENIVRSWRPSVYEGEYTTNRILELIAVYRPRDGFVRLVEYLQLLIKYERQEGLGAEHKAKSDLHLKALIALESYYPVAPRPSDDRDLAFKAYIKILQEDLDSPRYARYVTRRLIELGVIDLEETNFEYLFEHGLEVIGGLIDVLLEPEMYNAHRKTFTFIFAHCLKVPNGIDFFAQLLQEKGAALDFSQEGPILNIHKDSFIIELPNAAVREYMMRFVFGSEAERGRKKFEAVTSAN
ncbi:MAG TPA: hypothetical protein VE262_15975 [Blastocatellia bacterium]|nr:hypothetical protein [Blastocatellia bacterium]